MKDSQTPVKDKVFDKIITKGIINKNPLDIEIIKALLGLLIEFKKEVVTKLKPTKINPVK